MCHAHGTKIPKRYYCYCNKIEYLDDEIKGKSEYMVKDKIAAEEEARGAACTVPRISALFRDRRLDEIGVL